MTTPTNLSRLSGKCCRVPVRLYNGDKNKQLFTEDVANIILQIVALEERNIEQFYFKNRSNILYYYLESTGAKRDMVGGSPGGVLGCFRIMKKNMVVPDIDNNLTPVVPITPEAETQPEQVDLPEDMVSEIIKKIIGDIDKGITDLNIDQNTKLNEINDALVSSMNIMSVNKMFRKIMLEELNTIQQHALSIKVENADLNNKLNNVDSEIHLLLNNLLSAINNYDPNKQETNQQQKSVIDTAINNLNTYFKTIRLDDKIINNIILDILPTLKTWNLPGHAISISNIVKNKIQQDLLKIKPVNNARLMLPYINMQSSLKKIIKCMFRIIHDVPRTNSHCTLRLSYLNSSNSEDLFIVIINLNSLKIYYNNNQNGFEPIVYEITYDYPLLIPGGTYSEDIFNRFFCRFNSIIKNITYLKFVDSTISITGASDIVSDIGTILTTYPLSFFIEKAREITPEKKKWIFFGPMKYITGKIYKEVYKDAFCSAKREYDKINKYLDTFKKSIEQIQLKPNGGRRKLKM